MKLAADTSKIISSISALKALDTTLLSYNETKIIGDDYYSFYGKDRATLGDYQSDDLKGWWIRDNTKISFHVRLVEDDYDFLGNSKSDVSSISNFHNYGFLYHLDYLELREEIKVLVLLTGYSNLSDDYKKIALTYVVAGSGNDFSDSLYTTTQYENIALDHIRNSKECVSRRDLVYDSYSLILEGTQLLDTAICDGICDEMKPIRHDKLLHPTKGDLGDYVNSLNIHAPHNIISIDAPGKKITVSGIGLNTNINDCCEVVDSTANNKDLSIVSILENGGNTEITVSESLDSTEDGKVHLSGIRSHKGITVEIQGNYSKIENGKKKK